MALAFIAQSAGGEECPTVTAAKAIALSSIALRMVSPLYWREIMRLNRVLRNPRDRCPQ